MIIGVRNNWVKMKLLFVFTGGTIGSTFDGRFISPDGKKPYKLIEAYRKKYGFDDVFDVVEPYTCLSENNTGGTIKKLADCVEDGSKGDYDGIIVTHGTDTLQYSAAALGYVLGSDCIPVVLASSNYPVEDSRANGIDNMHGAVEFIKSQRKRGVWISYKNPNENVKIHRASRLLAGCAFSDRIDSIMNSYYGCFGDDFKFYMNPLFCEKNDEILPLSAKGMDDCCKKIMRVVPFPGMRYPEIACGVKYILHESYHSGTTDTVSKEARRFFAEAAEKKVEVFLTGVSNEAAYSSTKYFKELNIHPVINGAPPAMLMKLRLAVSSNKNPAEIMNKSLAGDIVI